MILMEGAQTALVVVGAIVLFILIILISCIRFVSQTDAYVVERLGKYHCTWRAGVHMLVPFIDHISHTETRKDGRPAGIVSLKEQVIDFDPQPVITKDNVTMQIDTVIFYQVSDPKLYVYGVSNPIAAIDKLTNTTLRNIMGNLELDEALTSRSVINEQMCISLDDATDPWGIKVLRVEVKSIMPPKDIRDAMEKQMRAERERREAILLAEGEKRSEVLKAEGYKEAEILRADAKREALIREAEGQAEAIRRIHEATAQGLEMLKSVKIDDATLKLKGYESLEKMAEGPASKIIIPAELQGIASLVATAKEVK